MKQLLITTLLLTFSLFAKTKVVVEPSIVVQDSSYQVTYTFKTSLPDTTLYSIFFKFNQVSQYMQKTILTISLKSESQLNNRINFHYNYLIAHLDMQIDREIDTSKHSVVFNMFSYKRSNKILPQVHNTTGHYAIINKDGIKRIHYLQATTLGTSIGTIYRKMILRENRKYLEALIEYIRDIEEQATTPVAPNY